MSDSFKRERDAEFFRERGFGLKIGFGKMPALLVVDILKASPIHKGCSVRN